VLFSLLTGKNFDSVLEICPIGVENPLPVSALSIVVAGRPAAEFCALGSGLAAEFGMDPAGGLFGIENSSSN
jgi:hypothetical protein